jgi:5-methylcytosine-specific restriction endonuclease McrA
MLRVEGPMHFHADVVKSGRHARMRVLCLKGRTGSNPVFRTYIRSNAMRWRFYHYRKKLWIWWITQRPDDNDRYCFYCKCVYGKGKRQRSLDHVIPLFQGGENKPRNMVFACVSCNKQKGSQNVVDFSNGPWLAQRRKTIENQASVAQ